MDEALTRLGMPVPDSALARRAREHWPGSGVRPRRLLRGRRRDRVRASRGRGRRTGGARPSDLRRDRAGAVR